MGFIGKVIGGAVKFIKPLAQTAIKAIAPQAAGLLKNITGDLFTKGKDFLTKALGASSLPSPLKSLAQKLLGKGFDALSKLAQGGIDKLLQKIVGSPAPRTTADGVTTTPPRIQDRADSLGANTPATGSSSSAATAGAGGTASASNAASASSAPASQGQATQSGFGWSGGAPSPVGRDMSDPNVAAKFQEEMMKYQQAMTNMQNFYQMMSAVFKSNADTTKNLIQNIR